MGKTKIAMLVASLLPLSGAFAQSSVQTLPEVKVTAKPDEAGPPVEQTTAGPVQGYRALDATSSTRTRTPLQEIPQSIQVIPRSLMQDQVDLSVTEALRNVSGVQGVNTLQTPAFNSTYIRGFSAEQWVDGMTNYYNGGNRDSLVNVERIEVLKGPSAILYGGGAGAPLGGVVNLISKLPTSNASREFGFTGGSHRFLQPYFDVNQPLAEDGTVLFRITGEYTSANSFVDVLNTDKYSVNPTLTLTNKDSTKLTIQGNFSKWKQQDYQALPATGTVVGSFRIDRSLFAGPDDIPKSNSEVHSVTATLDHKFNDVWSANVQARAGKTKFKEIAQNYVGTDFAANTPSFPPSSWNLLNIELYQEQKEATVTSNVQAKFSLGESKHTFVAGFDYSRLTDKGYMTGDLFGDLFFPGLGLVDLTNPAFPPYVAAANTALNTIADGDNRYITKGAYAQLQSTFWDRLHLLGGLRYAKLDIESKSPAFARTDTTDTSKVLPRIGAVVDLVKQFSVFASYSEGMKANPFVFYLGTPEPEKSKQKEGGVKFNLGNGFSGSAALFEINRTGVPVFTGIASEAIGKQRSRGYETDLLWQPNRNWQLLASYAHIDAELREAVPGTAAAGNQLNIVPRNSGRLWANYKFDPGPLAGWSVGAGVYAASKAYVDLGNVFRTDGYHTVDAKVAYETKYVTASVAIKNLTGEKYFVPFNYYGGRVAPGDDRSVYGTVAFKF